MTSTVHELTRQAADNIRTANHHTRRSGCLTVNESCVVVDDLARLARSLEQLLRQLDRNLHSRIDNGKLRHDSFGDPIDTVVDAAISLRHASRRLDGIADDLTLATALLARIADPGKDLGR